jgi:hypothetical protein
MIKKWIGGNFHLMKMYVCHHPVQSHRKGIADEMDFVASVSKFLP